MKKDPENIYSLLTEFSFNGKCGSFCVSNAFFTIKKAAVQILCGRKSILLQDWKLSSTESQDEENTLLEYETNTKYGKFFLSFLVSCNEVTIHLSAKLKKVLPKLTFYYFKDANISLPEHILFRSMNCPGTSSGAILTREVEKNRSFAAFDTVLTKEKTQRLFLSFPMAPDHFPVLKGTIKKVSSRRLLALSAEVNIKNFESREITLPPLSLRFSSGNDSSSFPIFTAKNIPEDELPQQKYAWNSWDYYRWTITEEEVLKNAEFIAADPVLSRHVKRIIIDDGWQYAYGEWIPNGLFPSGMEKMAKNLKKMGFEPGLWIAPGIVENVSRIAQMRYEMLAKSEDGYPAMMFSCMERRGFILDPTRKDVHEYWHKLFDQYASMGYEYFKLDFLASFTTIPKAWDNSIPRGRYTDLLFETILKAVNGRAKLMACGYPYLSGNPGVEAVRVGQDIHAKWDCIKANTIQAVTLYALGSKYWINDPDFALCRGVETSDDAQLNQMRPCLVYNKKEGGNLKARNEWCLAGNTKKEAEVLLSIVLASGGARTLSDAMYRLNKEGLLLARKVVSAAPGAPAVPLDLFTKTLPEYYLQNLANGAYRVLFINFSDVEKEYCLDLSLYGLPGGSGRDFWQDTPIKTEKNLLQKHLAPHSCFLAEFGVNHTEKNKE